MLPARAGRPPRTCAQQFFRGLPESAWSPALNAKLLQLAQSKVAMYDAYISEMEQFPADEEYLRQHRQSLGSRPVRVLSSRAHGVGSLRTLTPEERKYEDEVALAQGKWLQLSSNAKLVIANHSSEYIQFDQPDVVIEAIHEVLSEKRGAAHRAVALPSVASSADDGQTGVPLVPRDGGNSSRRVHHGLAGGRQP
jgi:hypothetical protein